MSDNKTDAAVERIQQLPNGQDLWRVRFADGEYEDWPTEITTDDLKALVTALADATERADRAEAALERVRTAWNKSWDCSRDPGHTIMSDAFAEATDEN